LSAGYVLETNKEFYGTFLSFQYVTRQKKTVDFNIKGYKKYGF
jgi:hypothetical protein